MSINTQGSRPLRFGVATADHQCEAFDPRVADIRDDWEQALGLTPRGRATDFWERYPEDVELARGLGCGAFRFSVAWSRVEPEPGRYDDAAFEHYRGLVRAIRDAGMVPVLTLLHFTWPKHVESRGGLADPGFPDLFRAYAAEVVRRIGEGVEYWITINEPNLVPFGYVRFWWQRNYSMPPGLAGAPEPDQVGISARVIRNLFLAHTAARDAIRLVHPAAKVSANAFLLGLPGWFQALSDWLLARQGDPGRWKARESRLAVTRSCNRGRADVTLAAIALTPDRERKALLSESYEAVRPTFLVKTNGGASDLAGLARARIALVRGTLQETLLPRVLPGATPVPVADRPAMIDALDRGQADAVFDDDISLAAIVRGHPGVYSAIDSGLPAEPIAAAVGLKNGDLLDVVDAAIRRFKESGGWSASRERHFPGQPTGSPPRMKVRASLSAPTRAMADGPALRTIRGRGYVIVAVEDRSPGLSELDPKTGERTGLEIDLAKAISREIFGARIASASSRPMQRAASRRSSRGPMPCSTRSGGCSAPSRRSSTRTGGTWGWRGGCPTSSVPGRASGSRTLSASIITGGSAPSRSGGSSDWSNRWASDSRKPRSTRRPCSGCCGIAPGCSPARRS